MYTSQSSEICYIFNIKQSSPYRTECLMLLKTLHGVHASISSLITGIDRISAIVTKCTCACVHNAQYHFIQIVYSSMSLHIQCTVCPVNEYVEDSPETCQPCPAMSTSPGGVVRVCPCMDGYGRVNESDPSLPCVGELVGD